MIIIYFICRVYRDNFLSVDLYYPELSFQRITQQVAFPAVSLLSEVGGFLGLLLGASLLTVCEIVDYITLLCIARWYKNNGKVYSK